ncbi:uncharacterized protein LOC136090507 [Hydra vulgaris]|uniref:Uncharacterized protein LOC136090507 n=1 Tax=Hydra vulgaris TaxID=6087 RepID=A0ABM4DFV1_HYDVU
MEDSIFESWIDRFIIHVKDYEKPVLLLCDGHNSHITYSTVKKALNNHIILLWLPPNTSHALQPLDIGFFAPLKSHLKKILKDWLRENRHKNVDKSVFPTLLKVLISKIDNKLLKSGFNGSGLYPAEKSKPMKKIVNMQRKHKEVDKTNKKENVVKNLQRAIDSVLTPSPSQPTLTVFANSKKRRARVQAKKGEILTVQDVVARLQEEEKNKAEKKTVSVSKRNC